MNKRYLVPLLMTVATVPLLAGCPGDADVASKNLSTPDVDVEVGR